MIHRVLVSCSTLAFALCLLAPTTGSAQVDPEWDGYVLSTSGGGQGEIDVDTTAGTVFFRWVNSTAAWPADFTADAGSPPSTSVVEEFDNPGFSGGATSTDISHCQYQIKSGGAVIGWLHYDVDGLTWYGLSAYIGTNGHFDVSDAEFQQNTYSNSQTVEKVYAESI